MSLPSQMPAGPSGNGTAPTGMTPNAMTPSGTSPRPPIGPAPLLAPSPMDVGGLVGTTMRAMRRSPGLFIGTVLAQMGVGVLAYLLGVALMAGVMFGILGGSMNSSTAPGSGAIFGFVLAGIVSMVVMMGAILWASIKFTTMAVAAVDQMARGIEPTWETTGNQTRGVVRRAAPLLLIALGVVVALWVLISVVVAGAVFAAASSGSSSISSGLGAGSIALLAILYPVLGIVGLYLETRLVYIHQALAVEGLSGLDVLRRSWALTKNRFWATLGNLIVGSLVPMVAIFVVYLLLALTSQSDATSWLAIILVPLLIVLYLATAVWGIVYTTVMYIDQVRRNAMQSGAGVALPQGFPGFQGDAGLAGGGTAGAIGQPGLGGAPVFGSTNFGSTNFGGPNGNANPGNLNQGNLNQPGQSFSTGSSAAPAPGTIDPRFQPQAYGQQQSHDDDAWGSGPIAGPGSWGANQSPQYGAEPTQQFNTEPTHHSTTDSSWQLPSDEHTATLGNEPTTQIPGEEPTRTLDDPWARPKDEQ